jgi:hypothetical protein
MLLAAIPTRSCYSPTLTFTLMSSSVLGYTNMEAVFEYDGASGRNGPRMIVMRRLPRGGSAALKCSSGGISICQPGYQDIADR